MRTVLFIDNSICSDLEQLKQYFVDSLSPNSPIYEELLTLYRDGILTEWLSEGTTKEEMTLLKKLDKIPKDLPNGILMETVTSIFAERSISIEKPTLLSYVDIESIEIQTGETVNNTIHLCPDKEVLLEKKELTSLIVCLNGKLKKADNENFKLGFVTSDRHIGCEKEILINKLHVGEKMCVKMPFPNIDYGIHHLKLCSESECIISFTANIVKSRNDFLHLDDYRAFRFGKVQLGITKSSEFGCEKNEIVSYLGAKLHFLNDLLRKIEAEKGTEAFQALSCIIFQECNHSDCFMKIYSTVKDIGFVQGESSLKLKTASQVIDELVRPSSMTTRLFFPHIALMRDATANILRSSDFSAAYKDELKKDTEDYVCKLKFYSGSCSGYDQIDLVRYRDDTLSKIEIDLK